MKETLAQAFPNLLKEWDWKNNLDNPYKLGEKSSKKVFWICSLGHSYSSRVVHRTVSNTNCPICSNHKIVIGFNDLTTTHPEIILEWNIEKNKEKVPSLFSFGSGEIVWWKCQLGHEYTSSIKNKISKNVNCPICYGRIALKGFNTLQDKYPQLIVEWDFDKNQISPCDVCPGSDKKIWWICKEGHSWKAKIDSRVRMNSGCAKCNAAKQRSKIEIFIENELKNHFNILDDKLLEYNNKSYRIDILLENKIIIEYDGWYWHKDKLTNDQIKTRELQSAGYEIIRIREGLDKITENDLVIEKGINFRSSKKTLDFIVQSLIIAVNSAIDRRLYVKKTAPRGSESSA